MTIKTFCVDYYPHETDENRVKHHVHDEDENGKVVECRVQMGNGVWYYSDRSCYLDN